MTRAATTPRQMRIVLGQFNEPSYEKLQFAKQLGVTGVLLNTPRLPGETHWEYDDLAKLRDTVNAYGLELEALENTPVKFYVDVMTGGPERDRQIERYQTTIRNVGKAGIPILGYHWMPNSVWRTQNSPRVMGRGGARVTVFDIALAKERDTQLTHGRVYSADELWENYERFIKAVIPVAEEAGVKLALHPDDPPVPSLGGVARIFNSFEGFKRGSEIVDSPNWGLDFCMGCWSEMGGHENVIRGVRHFVPKGKIYYVHFRDVVGTADNFAECFLGEGNVNLVDAMKTFKECGFTGFFIDDHVPHMVDDSDWGHRGRAYATGYMMALLSAVNALA
ncbi:MAG TPA: mannonate dehydratase [Chloroflexota bacterium]|nr:mannonate dehydratase [Chloroflexota bacterium]